MAERLHQARDKSLDTVVTIVHELLRDYHPRDFAIEFWDGSRWEPEQGNFCRFTWHVRTPAALRAFRRRPV